ncbi:hypothetical protein SUGI_0976720 [Cryptomeria japonica]|nr:hypothetical protein SUGI_0976720 [Cryptomeria japonica]
MSIVWGLTSPKRGAECQDNGCALDEDTVCLGLSPNCFEERDALGNFLGANSEKHLLEDRVHGANLGSEDVIDS